MITWLLHFPTHTDLNLREMGRVLAAALRKADDSEVETAVLDLGVKHYNKPKIRIGGKAKVWPSITLSYSCGHRPPGGCGRLELKPSFRISVAGDPNTDRAFLRL